MNNQPDPNPDDRKGEASTGDYTGGGDRIEIGGDVGMATAIGHGTVNADYIAGRDIIFFNGGPPKTEEQSQFADLMIKLRDLIIKAQQAGELTERTAKKALANLSETAEMIAREERPPKNRILSRLQYVADVLDAAVDFLSSNGNVSRVLLQALPIAVLLIKIATRIF